MGNDAVTPRTVLVADDDPQVRAAFQIRLGALGYKIVQAPDGLAAISKCRLCNVDALILDHDMPLGSGRDIANNIRRLTNAPIIFVSGQDREKFRETVMRVPDVYYLPKPVEMDRLTELLGSLTASKQPTNAAPELQPNLA